MSTKQSPLNHGIRSILIANIVILEWARFEKPNYVFFQIQLFSLLEITEM